MSDRSLQFADKMQRNARVLALQSPREWTELTEERDYRFRIDPIRVASCARSRIARLNQV
jgi:hypothetical protein